MKFLGPLNNAEQNTGEPVKASGGLKKIRPLTPQEIETSALREVEETMKYYGSQAVKPAKNFMQFYKEEREGGIEDIKRSIDNPSWWKTPLGMAAGALRYTFSPLTAIGKTTGDALAEGYESALNMALPTNDPEQIASRKEAAKWVGKIGEEAVYWIPLGGTLKAAMIKDAPAIGKIQKFGAIKDTPKASLGKKAEAILDKPKKVTADTPLTTGQVNRDIVNDITLGAETALKGKVDESKRIFKQIADSLRLGEIQVESLPEILGKYKIGPEEFAKMYLETVSTAGSVLGMHGRAAQRLRFAFKDSPEALAILGEAAKKEAREPNAMDTVFGAIGKMENFRRSMLVGQVATALRNTWSQAGRLAVASLDDALQGAIRGAVNPGSSFKEITDGLNVTFASIGRLSPKNRNRLANILEENHAALSKARLFSQPVHEVTLGNKLSYMVNTLNRAQEHFFRRIAFEAKLRTLLKRKGMDFNTVNPKHIPEDVLAESVNYALEMTFAASPKSRTVQNFIRGWNQVGLTTVNPFPRFAFANAVPFVFDHSPLGYLKAAHPNVIKELASGNPDRFAKHASRATLGTLMLQSATALRNSEHTGERWYEIKTSESPDGSARVIDTRAFAPFSTYLFLAEAMTNPERLKPKDYVEALIGLNRTAGSGLVFADMISARSGETLKKQVKNFIGQYAASFTVPLRTASDMYSGIDPEEGIYRDYKESPLIAPTLLNIPEVSQIVPEKKSPTSSRRARKGVPVRVGDTVIPAGVFRQMTGLSKKHKTLVEREIDQIGMDWSRISPRTGIPEADRALAGYMGPVSERVLPVLINNPKYKSAPVAVKRMMLSEAFKEIRANASRTLKVENPELAIKVALGSQSEDAKTLLMMFPAVRQYLEEK